MRAKEIITELFQNTSVPWKWEYAVSDEVSAIFTVGGIVYHFHAYNAFRSTSTWILEFRSDSIDGTRSHFGKTGTGNSALVMSTIVAITKEFFQSHRGITELRFSASETSRQKLYVRMIHRLLPNWEIRQKGEDFALISPNHTQVGPAFASGEAEELDEYIMDNEKGAGAVPYNREIDYFGVRAKVQPLTFLRNCAELTVDSSTERRIIALAKYMQDGGAIGSPMLSFDIPDKWESGDFSEPARIISHEGRHRMEAIIKNEGNSVPVEVHFLFPGLRRRHVTDEWLNRLNQSVVNERGVLINGPWFKVIQ